MTVKQDNEPGDAAFLGEWNAASVTRISDRLGVAPLAEFAGDSIAAARYIDCGEDFPDMVLSCAWRPGGVWVETAFGMGAGSSYPTEFRRAWLPPGVLPHPLRNWRRALSAVIAAPSVVNHERMCIGGPFFFHQWQADGKTDIVEWAWPASRDKAQWLLVNAYRSVWTFCWVRALFPAGRTRRHFPPFPRQPAEERAGGDHPLDPQNAAGYGTVPRPLGR